MVETNSWSTFNVQRPREMTKGADQGVWHCFLPSPTIIFSADTVDQLATYLGNLCAVAMKLV
jgi:hypothetical protein